MIDIFLKEPIDNLLSTAVLDGYIAYLQVILGRGIALVCYQYPLSLMNAEYSIRGDFEKAMTGYFYAYHPNEPRPLPYTYVSLLQLGLRECLGNKAAAKMTYKIGYTWWSGLSNIRPDQNALSIKNMLMKEIISYQNRNSIQKSRGPIAFYRDLIRRYQIPYCTPKQSLIARHQDLILLIMRKMGIEYIIQNKEGYEITITTCPFCCNRYSDCQVIAGITDNATEWFKETIAPDAHNQTITVTHSHEQQHHIAVTLNQRK